MVIHPIIDTIVYIIFSIGGIILIYTAIKIFFFTAIDNVKTQDKNEKPPTHIWEEKS